MMGGSLEFTNLSIDCKTFLRAGIKPMYFMVIVMFVRSGLRLLM